MKISALIALFLFLAIAQAIPPAAVRTSFTTDDLVRIRCSQNPDEETYFFFNGSVTAYLGDGEYGTSLPPTINATTGPGIKLLFNAVGINIAKCYKSSASPPVWYLVGREALWYLDPVTDKIVNTWTNLNGESVNVMHVDNDPVMQTFTTVNPPSFGPVLAGKPTTFVGQVYGNEAILPSDVTTPLNYVNPLNTNADDAAKFAAYAPQKYYQAAELFNFISPTNDVFSSKDSVDSTVVTWTRTGPFLPWMKMGNRREGYLLYSFRGAKIPDYTYLPYAIKADIENRVPHYKHAPQSKCFPDLSATPFISQTGGVTSWTFFKEQFDNYQAGVQYPLATPRSYGCRTGAYTPAADTTCKASASLNYQNQWTSNGQTITQYDISITNVGSKAIAKNSLFITLNNVEVQGSWNIVRQGSSNVWQVTLWNDLAAGATVSGAYGIQVTQSGAGANIGNVAVTCV